LVGWFRSLVSLFPSYGSPSLLFFLPICRRFFGQISSVAPSPFFFHFAAVFRPLSLHTSFTPPSLAPPCLDAGCFLRSFPVFLSLRYDFSTLAFLTNCHHLDPVFPFPKYIAHACLAFLTHPWISSTSVPFEKGPSVCCRKFLCFRETRLFFLGPAFPDVGDNRNTATTSPSCKLSIRSSRARTDSGHFLIFLFLAFLTLLSPSASPRLFVLILLFLSAFCLYRRLAPPTV